MDPITLIGAVASTGAIIGGITKTVHYLSNLRGRFAEADLTLGVLINELSAVKGALHQIQEWSDTNHNCRIQEELGEALRISLEGCRECLDLLADDVSQIIGDPVSGGAETSMRIRFLWNESAMKDHHYRLHTQMSALQLLLSAVTVKTLAGQAAIIRQPEARELMKKVKDDTSSMRSHRRHSVLPDIPVADDAATVRTATDSTLGSTVFPHFDREIMSTNVYRNHGSHARARHFENEMNCPVVQEPPMMTANVERRRPQQPRLDTVNLTPNPPQGRNHSPLTPNSWSPDAEYQHALQQALQQQASQQTPQQDPKRLSPVTPVETSNRPTLHHHYSLNSRSFQEKSQTEQKEGFRSRLRRAISMSAKPASSTPTPASPSMARNRSYKKRKTSGAHARSIDVTSDSGQGVPPILRAAQLGSVWEVKDLIDHGADIEVKHIGTGRTPLAVAAHCGNWELCGLLIEQDADLEAQDVAGKTPLHLAIEHDHVEAAAILLQRGARHHVRDHQLATPLHKAVKLGSCYMVTTLLQYGADVEAKDVDYQSPIHYAAAEGDLDVIDALLSHKKIIECPGQSGMTPLMVAAKHGNVSAVEAFLAKKALIKAKSERGWQALHYAASAGHTDVIELLLQKKAPIDARTADDLTPMMLASISGGFATVELLLRKGAQIEAQCTSANRCLHYACNSNTREVVKLLLEARGDFEAQGSRKRRPIHIATANGNQEIVQLLINKGANIEARDADGERPVCMAAAYGNLSLLRIFVERGGATQLKFGAGSGIGDEDSALCLACKHGQLESALYLMSVGASLRQRDEQGWQPLRYAVHFGWPEIVEVLLANGALSSPNEKSSHVNARFATFAPSVDGDRKARVLMLLQVAEAREPTPALPAPAHIPPSRDDLARELGLVTLRPAVAHEMPTERTPPAVGQGGPHPSGAGAPIGGRPPNASNPTISNGQSRPNHSPFVNTQQNGLRRSDTTYRIDMPSQFIGTTHHYKTAEPPVSALAQPSLSVPTPAFSQTGVSPLSPEGMPPSYYASASQAPAARDTSTQSVANVCLGCWKKGLTAPDYTCASCRENLYLQSYNDAAIPLTMAGPPVEMDVKN